MAEFTFRYGDGKMNFNYPEEDIIGIIEPGQCDIPQISEKEKIIQAIENPVGMPRLEEVIKPGESVCMIVPDITRQWGRPAQIIEELVLKLEKIGVKDEDILILCGTGTHRKQTPEEHALIVSQGVYDRIKVEDHDCDNNLVKVGTSFRGNDFWVNATAMKYDHRMIVGATVFHFLAGFGAGRKYVLPGISGRSTIMSNHSMYFAPGGIGSGTNPEVALGKYDNNPVSREMYEVADLIGITMNVTGVIGPDKKLAFCFAGELHESHRLATEKCRELDGVAVDAYADCVIACGMGYPKDINLYQTTSKTISNSTGVIKKSKDSVQIIVAECRDGIGNEDTVKLLTEMDNAIDRENYTRENYTVGLNIAYMLTQTAEEHHLIVVSDIDPEIFKKSKIHGVHTIEEAIELARKLTGKEHMSTYLMPYAANTCAYVSE